MTAAALLIASCDNTPKIQVSGAIGQAADSLLIFENMALAGPTIIDSLRLDADGEFAFKAPAPEGSPEFYRLRIGNQIINIRRLHGKHHRESQLSHHGHGLLHRGQRRLPENQGAGAAPDGPASPRPSRGQGSAAYR